MRSMSPAFRLAWVTALAENVKRDSIAALASMFQYPDVVEVTWAKLKAKSGKFPRDVARHVALYLARSEDQSDWATGVQLLKQIDEKIIKAVLDSIAEISVTLGKPNPWPKFVKKLRAEIKRS